MAFVVGAACVGAVFGASRDPALPVALYCLPIAPFPKSSLVGSFPADGSAVGRHCQFSLPDLLMMQSLT